MMDFSLAESQQAVADLAAQVLAGTDPWKELVKPASWICPSSTCSTPRCC